MLKCRNYLFFGVLALFIAPFVAAQQFSYTYYTTSEGLPTDLLKATEISPSGFPLIATDDGLVLFDGQHFSLYKESLPGHLVKFVHRTPEGRLLVTDDMGLSRVNISDCQVHIEIIKKGSIVPSDTALWYPKLIYTDGKQRTWITDNRTIYRYQNGQLIPLGLNMKSFPENVQRSFMLADEGSGYLFAFYEGGMIYRIQPETYEVAEVFPQYFKKQFFFAASFYKNKIWAAAREGLWEFRTEKGQIVSEQLLIPNLEFSWIENLDKDMYLGGTWSQGLYLIILASDKISYRRITDFAWQNINHIKNDGKGHIWISSDNGLALMQKQFFENPFAEQIKDYIQGIALAGDEILIAENSRIWSVTRGKKGFEATTIIDLPGETVLRVAWDGKKIWWSTAQGNIYHTTGKGGSATRIFSGNKTAIFLLVPDGRGRVWFCQDGLNAPGYIDLKDHIVFPIKEESLNGSRIISIALHPHTGKLYLGGTTDKGYLWEYDPEANSLKNLSLPLYFQHNIPIAINDISFGRDQAIWLASTFGVLKIDAQGRLARLEHDNIAETAVKSLTFDHQGDLWFTLSLGLVKWDGVETYIFSERDGLPSKTTSYRTLIEDKDGYIWVGTISGVGVPTTIHAATETPQPLIGVLEVNGTPKPVEKLKAFSLFKGDFLRLSMVAPAFPSRSLIYRYRLISAKDTSAWQNFRNVAEIFTDKLPTGNFKIEIEVRKVGNYKWSKPKVLDIKIMLKWYQNRWIIASGLLLLVFVIVLIIRYQAAMHRARELELELVISERTKEILAQSQKIEEQNADIIRKNIELEASNKALTEAKLKAEKLAQSRSLFLSTISHELRTPLNAVIGMTYILLNENPRPDQIENLNTLKFSAESLLALINDILDYSKIDAGKLVFEEADFDIHEKVYNVVQVLQVKAKEKGIQLLAEVQEDIPEFVIGDPTRFTQILFNLAGNAVKFTHEGYVKIKLSLLERSTNHVTIKLDVLDTGIGIPSDKLPQIFESFSQAGLDITRKYGGTGLGLAITKSLVEMQGGRIEVTSEPGKGSCFSVFISYRISSKVREKADKPHVLDYITFNGENVLVVDDNQVNLIVASKFLSKWNLHTDTAENGLEALEKFKQKKYALVLMDLQMPEMDGRTATKKIREYERENGLQPTPIYALTASALSDHCEQLHEVGIDDFITKPFNPSELNIKIQKVLKS